MISRIDLLKEFLEKDENDSFSRYGLAMEYAKRGDHEMAIREFRELNQRDPAYVAAYYQLAKSYEAIEQIPSAIDIYKRGLSAALKKNDLHAASELQSALDELEDRLV